MGGLLRGDRKKKLPLERQSEKQKKLAKVWRSLFFGDVENAIIDCGIAKERSLVCGIVKGVL